jgi:hypothetical protein
VRLRVRAVLVSRPLLPTGQAPATGPFHTERGVVPHRLGGAGVASAKGDPGATDGGDVGRHRRIRQRGAGHEGPAGGRSRVAGGGECGHAGERCHGQDRVDHCGVPGGAAVLGERAAAVGQRDHVGETARVANRPTEPVKDAGGGGLHEPQLCSGGHCRRGLQIQRRLAVGVGNRRGDAVALRLGDVGRGVSEALPGQVEVVA